VGAGRTAAGPTNGIASCWWKGCEEVEVEVVAGLCHGHSNRIVAEDVCSTIVEGAGYDAAVAWEL
jgi:hypothetical protein